MLGSAIQATKIVEFEDGLWIGNHPKARNILQRVCTIPGVQPGVVAHPGSSEGRLNSNLSGSTWLLGVEPGAGFDSRQLQCAHPGFSRGRLNSNLPGSAWMLCVSQAPGSISSSRGVRIDLA